MVFPDSTALNACPNLRGRHCSALCVSMSIGGSSIGVFHVTTEDGSPPSDGVEKDVEVVARRASERLAMLRAFEVSQTEANSDSLTGLTTRRSLETAVRDLRATGMSYSVAYGDLDRFKDLNDTFGHAAGDRAVRTFSQVLGTRSGPSTSPDATEVRSSSSSCRSARWTKPDRSSSVSVNAWPSGSCSLTSPVHHQLRRLVSSRPPTFDQVVSLADTALLSAKAGGRDQVVTSAGQEQPAPTPVAVSAGSGRRTHSNGDSIELTSREPQHS